MAFSMRVATGEVYGVSSNIGVTLSTDAGHARVASRMGMDSAERVRKSSLTDLTDTVITPSIFELPLIYVGKFAKRCYAVVHCLLPAGEDSALARPSASHSSRVR